MTLVAGRSLEDLLALRELDRAAVRARFEIAGEAEDVAYEGLDGVDRLDPTDLPVHFFFRGDEQVMLYVPERGLQDLVPSGLTAALGEPEASLRSRAGGDSELLVWATRGVAASTDGDRVELLEVFAPRPPDAYESEIYSDPGEFIR